jgi:predicted helicase
MGALGIQGIPIDDERREANRIKAQQPILAIIGNPPYKRLEEGENETLVGRWIDELWDDLKAPVREAGQGGQLNTFPEFSVAFWRWAMWKLFEAEGAPQHGVVAFITNRKFLTGWPYAGLRKMMRERFDRIEIIDLRGDVRAGPRGDVDGDTGVFNIQVGTAITLAIADGSKEAGSLANVSYYDSWSIGKFSRSSKLDWLVGGSERGTLDNPVRILRDDIEDFRPKPFENGQWVNLRETFLFSKSGMKSGDDPTFVAVDPHTLQHKVHAFLATRPGREYDANNLKGLSYRPFDRRIFYNDMPLLNRPGPAMQAAWGEQNVGLYAMPSGTGAGPAVWCHGELPDYHAFRGSYGGYAFPLHDRRRGAAVSNLSPNLLASLAEAYGVVVQPADVFDAILALLSAQSYTRRFAEDLEDVFPHVPFPADHAVLMQAAEIGREIRAVETFARPPGLAFLTAAFCRLEAAPDTDDVIGAAVRRNNEVTLCPDGRGRFSGLPDAVWDFSVSGYRVLPRWIEGRRGLPANRALLREFRDVAGRIAELIHWFHRADLVLEAVLANTLTREELGFPPAGGPAEDGDA